MMAAPPWMPSGVGAWPPAGLSGGIHTRLLGFVKAALLRQLVPPNSVVCDLFCGRGLDTERWAKAGVGRYVGVDLSASALEEAQEQWEQHDRPFPAEFCELDPCMVDLEAHLKDQALPADIVSCLAHLQDSFTSEEMVKRLLKNVEAVLKPGGFFFGTTPDSSTIWYKYQKAVQDAMKDQKAAQDAMKAGSLRVNGTLPSVRTDVYKITFDDDRFHYFGSKYHMRFTDDGLPAQPQLLVHFPSLIRLAKEVGLECVEIQNLSEFYDDYGGPFADVLRSCCGSLVDHKGVPVLDAKGRLNGQALDVLSLYTTFIFKKGDSAMSNMQVSPSLEPVFKVSSSAAKYLTNFPSQHSETFSESMNEEPDRKEQQFVKGEDHDPLNSTMALNKNAQPQQDSFPQHSETPADPVDDLSVSRLHLKTWHDQGEGISEAMREGSADQAIDENIVFLDNGNNGQLRGHMEEDLKKNYSSPPDGPLFQMGTTDEDSHHPAKQMVEPDVGQAEFKSWPTKGARTLAAESEDPHWRSFATRGHGMSRGSRTTGPPTLMETGHVSLMEVENVEEPPPVDLHAKQFNFKNMNKSLEERSGVEKQQGSPPADHSPKHSVRGRTESLDENSRGEKELEPSQVDHCPEHDNLGDSSRDGKKRESALADPSPKHYMRRVHENLESSSRSRSQQEIIQGDRSSKHYLRRTYENRDEGRRSETQRDEPLADHNFKSRLRRIHESVAKGNRREKQKVSPSADLTSRHYERRTYEKLDDRSRSAKQQDPLHGDNSSKHYMRRNHDSSDEGTRSEKGRLQSGRLTWVDKSISQHESRCGIQSSPRSRSREELKRFPVNTSKPNATNAYGQGDLATAHAN